MDRPPQEPGSGGWLPPQPPGGGQLPGQPPPSERPASEQPGRAETDPGSGQPRPNPTPPPGQSPSSPPTDAPRSSQPLWTTSPAAAPPPPPPPPPAAYPGYGYAQPYYQQPYYQQQPYPGQYAAGWPQHGWTAPGQWPQQPAYAHPSYGPEPDNDPAIASLTLALSGLGLLLFSAGFSAAIVSPAAGAFAIYYGKKGMEKVDKGETRRYRGAAKAGFILGIVTVVLSIAAAAIWIVVIASNPEVFEESSARFVGALGA